MALRAKKPELIRKRLKLLMYASSGVGKTTAAIQFPKAYIIDTEKGAQNYSDIIAKSGSVVFESCSYDDIMTEVRSLMTERHDFQTLILDSGTPLYAAVTEEAERGRGESTFKSWADADKQMRRLFNAMVALDMNVIVTSHQKTKYIKSGASLVDAGQTFDGWKRLDYMFDLALRLERQDKGKERTALVEKTRIHTFPDMERFPWSYDIMVQRYEAFAGVGAVTGASNPVALCTEDQAAELLTLMGVVNMGEDWLGKVLARAGVDAVEEMQAAQVQKCIDMIRAKVPSAQTPREEMGNFFDKRPGAVPQGGGVTAEQVVEVVEILAGKTPQQIAAAVPGLTTGETLKSPLPDGEPKRRGRPKATAAGSNPGEQTLPQASPDPKPAAAATSGSTPKAPAPSSVATPTSAAAPSKTGGSTTPVLDRSSSQEDQIPDVEEQEPLFEEDAAPPAPPAKNPEPEDPKRKSVLDHSPYLKFVDAGNDLVEGEVNDDDFNDYIMFLATKFGFYAQDKAVELCQKRRAASFTTPDRAGNFARRRSQLIAAIILGRLTPAGVVVPPITPEELKLLGLPTK
jgi:hypothetical protein